MINFFFLAGRILVGGYFIMSGYKHFAHLGNMTGYARSKGMPMAREGVLLTGVMMLAGGLGVLLGVYVHPSIYFLVVFLILAAFTMHRFWTESDPMAKMGDQINFMKNIALAGALLMMLSIPLATWATLLQ